MGTEQTSFPSVCIERMFAAIESATGNSFCIHVVAKLSGRIDAIQLASAIRLMVDREPAFRTSFEMGWFQPYWKLHHDLEECRYFEIVETENEKSALDAVLATSMDLHLACGIKTYLIRGSRDTICVKFNHKVGDAQAGKQFMYQLASTYSRLGHDAQYTPPEQTNHERSVMQITQLMSAADQQRVLRLSRSNRASRKCMDNWYLRSPLTADTRPSALNFHCHHVASERYAMAVQYAREHRTTVNTVLLAAFAKAAANTIPRSSGTRSQIHQTVDLRRYLADRNSHGHCNLSSMLALAIEQESADPLAAYVSTLHSQMEAARQNFIGLAHPLIRWELNRKRRFLFNCIPFRVIRRRVLKRIRNLERAGSPCRLVFSNIGKFDPELLKFANIHSEEACFIPGRLMQRELLLLLVSEFGGRLSMAYSYSPCHVDGVALGKFMDELVRNLPE